MTIRYSMPSTFYGTCPICEATCGIAVEYEGDRILRVRGDEENPFSRGYICPKGTALPDIQHDPDRIRRPLRRNGGTWQEVGWDEALDEAAEKLIRIQREHGRDSIGVFLGNPTAHSYSVILSILSAKTWGTRSIYTSNSVDAWPRTLTSYFLYGSQALLPIPDIDRTHFIVIIGGNPAVSNGSLMTAPAVGRRIMSVRKRGGRVVVIDPRRTETAALADVHHFIRPGTDALLILSLLNTIFAEGLRPARPPQEFFDGLDRVKDLCAPYPPERVSTATGIAPETIRALARDFARSPSAVCYGRMGTCAQEFGTLATWLIDLLNIVTGNLDRPGGAMFTTPAADLADIARRSGESGGFGRWRSRVRGLPEVNGELPSGALAEEIETPGPGQLRALVTHAGNPVLSVPNSIRMDRALDRLEFMVSIDIYINETTRHAHLILPPTFGLEHDHYPLLFHALSVRNVAKYSPALLPKPPGSLHDWEILLDLTSRMLRRRGALKDIGGRMLVGFSRWLTPRGVLGLALRFGPHGKGLNPFGKGLTLGKLLDEPHGIDLGPLRPGLPGILQTRGKKISLAPEPLVTDIGRLEAWLRSWETGESTGRRDGDLSLVWRRQLRSCNTWMHNSPRLVKGENSCTLLMNPRDANARGLRNGDRVKIASPAGSGLAELEVSEEMMHGVVSLPFGWGHGRPGTRLSVANQHPGVNINDLTDDRRMDSLSGNSDLSGVRVSVSPIHSSL